MYMWTTIWIGRAKSLALIGTARREHAEARGVDGRRAVSITRLEGSRWVVASLWSP